MRHITFSEQEKYSCAVLIKASAFTKSDISKFYLAPMQLNGVSTDDCIAFTLEYDALGKVTAKSMKEYLDELLPIVVELGITHLYVADAAYFKTLTKENKAEAHLGYVLPCKYGDYAQLKVVLGINYQALIFNPILQDKLDLSIKTLCASLSHQYVAVGSNIIHHVSYPETLEDIRLALNSLHQYPRLTADIEAFSLKFNEAGIGSISFAWNQHEGLAFLCDYWPFSEKENNFYGKCVPHAAVRKLLLEFFLAYQGELVWHNAAYDVKVIIYVLWMQDLLDTAGLLNGLEVMTRSFQDTKIVAYLATNSTAGNELSLKALAHPFAGNWAQDEIKDIRKIAPKDLLQYNLVDALGTFYVLNTYGPVMVLDKQETLYKSLMLPTLVTIIQMELSGMPLNKDRVQEVKTELMALQKGFLDTIEGSPVTKAVEELLTEREWLKDFEDRRKKAKIPDKILPKNREDYPDSKFNPNSGPQMQVLIYEHMALPVIDYTDSKQPATGADTLEKLVNHTDDPLHKELLSALIGLGGVAKILSSFIPAFEAAIVKEDGWAYLHGSFNLGGTVSGRLSSSKPNLTNIPAGSTYGKLIKTCFEAPPGWIFAGADFASLEDRISALTTKDSNKLAVYTKGYDGHSMRAAYYFRDQLPHIDLEDPKSVNTIKKTHEDLRQESKAPTFLLTYGGTFHGMMKNLGWTMEKSKAIEANYHELYKESDAYVAQRLKQASKDGYVEVAFGLRVRTPLLKQVIWGSCNVPYEAQAEGRTAGNALGQSYCLLTNRAANAFMEKVRQSPYKLDIKMVAQIHDAIYLMIRDDIEIVEWANRELTEAMAWQDLPKIAHPIVKLGGDLDIFWPTWANATTLPNDADQATILAICAETKQKYLLKKDTP